jgi:CubicO group peptidase (beta-lactamase class C family)
MQKSIILFFTILNLFVGQRLFSQGYNSIQIDSLVNKAMSISPSAGVAVVVVKDDKIIHMKGYGVTSINSKGKVDENTLFAIASNSKAFTTAALAMLEDEGKLDWNDKVVKHIPEFKMYDPYVTENFNIQDLLTHRSGLGLGAGDLLFFPDGSDFGIEDVLNSFQYQEPVSAFRTKYDYDNLLYVVAGEVVARVSGMSWAEFVETKIMKSLGMQNSAGVYQRVKNKSNMAFPHSTENGKLRQLKHYTKNNEALGAAGGIYANVNDLSKWLFLHLNNGKYGDTLGKQLISEKNHAELWKAHTNISFDAQPTSPYKTHFEAYGLGWDLSDVNGKIKVEHTGGLPGMLSRTILIPEMNLGIIVLTNTDSGGYGYYTISQEILESFLGTDAGDYILMGKMRVEQSANKSDKVTAAVWETVAKADKNAIKPADYVGIYKDDWFGKIEVFLKENQLWFKSYRSPKLNGPMQFYQANTFAIKWEYQDMNCDAFAMFTLDDNGKAQSIKMEGISPDIDFSFDFQDLDLVRVNE